MKPRVILDIAFLGHAHHAKTERRGVQRVVNHLFHGLLESNACDLSFVASSHLAATYDFLALQARPLDERLRYSRRQLPFSRIGQRLHDRAQKNISRRSFAARAQRYLSTKAGALCTRNEVLLTASRLRNADIYHSPHRPFSAAVQSARHLRKFLTLHDFIPLRFPAYPDIDMGSFMSAIVKCLAPETFAFCVSESTRNDALNFSSLRPDHVFVTPLAADERWFHPVTDFARIEAIRQEYGIPPGPYFLALSAPDRQKNFPHLIRCFGKLAASGDLPEMNLVIGGANFERNSEAVLALDEYPQARPRIIPCGFVQDEDLAPLYTGARAFLFPSLAEGFGIPPLEAMQCGTPVIASNTTSMPEVIGDAGVLLPPTDEDAWCQAMLDLASDDVLHGKLKERSLRRCRLFSWDRFIQETLRGYRTALAAV